MLYGGVSEVLQVGASERMCDSDNVAHGLERPATSAAAKYEKGDDHVEAEISLTLLKEI